MLIHFRNRIRFPLHSQTQIPRFSKTLKILAMQSNPNPKRSICPSCSKPARTCLCSRIRTRNLDNSVSVTILQHSLERNHPLNSTRIAKLGLKNLNVVTVFEVDFEARFEIRLLEPGHEENQKVEGNGKCLDDRNRNLIEKNGEFSLENKGLDPVENLDVSDGDEPKLEKESYLDANMLNGAVFTDGEGPAISAMMVKYGCITDLSHIWNVEIHGKKRKFDHVLTSPLAREALAGGFVVKKIERKKSDGKMEVEENEEFEVKVPPGSVLLFPSQNAVGVDDLKSMDFEVKNLIVLDGTWSKAGRVYNENPWLKLLPHLRLDLDKMSLYSEIRHQPKAGCLSTIESIVYTLKALGDNVDGLDNLLDVFESMVGDQRRFKHERLSKGKTPSD